MAEKGGHQQLHAQSPPANMDIESSAAPAGGPAQSEDLRSRPRRSRTKIIVFIVLLIVFHSIIVVTLDLTIFRIRTPKYRLKSVTMDNLVVTNSPSFRMKLDADVTIKNKNFGPYKYHDCYMTLSYRGERVGEAFIKEGGAKALSTKVMKLSLNVTYYSAAAGSDGSNLRNDISSGSLGLSSKSEMRGQVEVLKVLKRDNKYPKMDCAITIDLADKVVRDLKCD